MASLSSSPSYPLVLDRARRFAFTHSVRLLDFMKPFDKLNHGEITLPQFHRGLAAAGIRVSEAEARCLAAPFECEKADQINYRDFCEELNKVFRTTGLEETPFRVPPQPGEVLLPPASVYPADAAAAAEKTISRLRLLTETRRLDLRAAFSPFDKHNTGKVSLTVFERAFPIAFRENKFTEDEVRQLGKYLMTSDGLVDTHKLRLLVEGPPKGPKPPFRAVCTAYASSAAADPAAAAAAGAAAYGSSAAAIGSVYMGDITRTWGHEERSALTKIETAVAARQLPLGESFRDFDGLRHGVCSKEQAQAVLLSVLRIPLEQSDWRSLFDEFVNSDGRFDYWRLCKEIDSRLCNPEAEMHPTRVVPVRSPPEMRELQQNKTTMTQEEQEKLKKLQQRLCFQVKQTRKLVVPTFYDFDKRRTQHVTRRQLWRILGMLDLPVTEEELDLLCLWLCDRGNLEEVGYRPLLALMDRPELETENSEENNNLSDKNRNINDINGSYQSGTAPHGSIYFQESKVVPLAETIARASQR